jgi:hypothetical protein
MKPAEGAGTGRFRAGWFDLGERSGLELITSIYRKPTDTGLYLKVLILCCFQEA